MNLVEIISNLMTLDTSANSQIPQKRRIVPKSQSIKDSDSILEKLKIAARTTSDGWFVCALTPSVQLLKAAEREEESLAWMSTAKFPTSGEGFSQKNNTSWHFIHLGAAMWQWTEWRSEEADDSITVIENLVNHDGCPMSYEICYSPFDLGSHLELRPTAQRFIGFRSSLAK